MPSNLGYVSVSLISAKGVQCKCLYEVWLNCRAKKLEREKVVQTEYPGRSGDMHSATVRETKELGSK
ncbi:hypothetical protein V6N12_033228 [Hibiscus sabdariffa]|uniref:Uncharacterized protein n=1 Tax=Hibiscus sabdariffa TaxID=183260 RepID=A0ABR2BAS6_9ROSI